jgi:hypothetical protein
MLFGRGKQKEEGIREAQNERLLTAQRYYLETLRRELGRYIFVTDMEAFITVFDRMRRWESELERADKSRLHAEYRANITKFPDLQDFDIVGVRHFLGPESSFVDLDQLIERYEDISRYLIIDRLSGSYVSKIRVYDDTEADVLNKEIRRTKDRRLKDQIDEGMKRYYIWRRAKDEPNGLDTPRSYDDAEFEVFGLDGMSGRGFTPDIQYGVVCKKLNENGVYSFFVADEGKTYYSYYRTDQTFTKDTSLDWR